MKKNTLKKKCCDSIFEMKRNILYKNRPEQGWRMPGFFVLYLSLLLL